METEFPRSIGLEPRNCDKRSPEPPCERGFEEVIKDLEPKSHPPKTPAQPSKEESSEEEPEKDSLPEISLIAPMILELLEMMRSHQSTPKREPDGKILRNPTKDQKKIPFVGEFGAAVVAQSTPKQTTKHPIPETQVTPGTPLERPVSIFSAFPVESIQRPLELQNFQPIPSTQAPVSNQTTSLTLEVSISQDLDVRHFRAGPDGGETRMKVKLADGDVLDLKLSVRDSVANVTLRTARPEMVKLLQESIHELVASLESQGLEVGVDVGHEPQDEGRNDAMAHFVQKESDEAANVDAPIKRDPAWHYITVRGRIYVVA